MVDQSGYTIKYVYTPAGELSKLTVANNIAIVTYTYDAAGRLTRQDNANGTYSTYQYDAAGNVLHLINSAPGGGVNSRFDYSYNLLGQVTGMATLDGAWAYTYDAAGQLIRAIFTSTNPALPNQDLAYSYDPAGNRTSTVINGVTTAYTANAMNEYTNIGSALREYDSDGNLLNDGTSTYTYNQLDELTGVTNAQGTTQYTYNALGQRIDATVNGQTTQYLIDPAGLGNVVSQYNGAGTLLSHFDYGLALVSQTTAAGASYFYDFDATGSAVGLSDATGAYVNSYRYMPFGRSLTSSVTVANPFQYVGAFGVQTDSPNLLYMRARFYVPSSGSFVSSDPLQLHSGDTNFYRYVSNQPIQFADPSGFDTKWIEMYSWVNASSENSHDNVAGSWAAQGLDPEYNPDHLIYEAEAEALQRDVEAFHEEIRDLEAQDIPARPFRPAMPDDPDDPTIASTFRKIPDELNYFMDHPLKFLANVGQFVVGKIVDSADPNDKVGPGGFGAASFIASESVLPYRIDFENASTASAPAQQVEITDQLDSNLDWSTFTLDTIGWGDTVIAVPANEQHFQTTVPMTYNGQTFDVLVQVGINLGTGLITAQVFSIDPVTELPPDVLTGFLPPEDGTGRGQGFITYSILANAGLPTGTAIRNVADVSFDETPIIATDQVSETDPTQGTDPSKEALVTIDAGPPTSAVAALPAVTTTTSFSVSWSGSDDAGGSGIASYNVYVSDDGGPYTLFTSSDSAGSATFTGQKGQTYAFYSIATDNVGNQEAVKSVPDASTTVTVPVTETWSGGGAGNDWSTGANWTSLAAPNPGDSLVFQGAVQTATNNDLLGGTLQSITLAAPGFQLGGNAVTLASASTPVVTLSAASGTIQLPITLGSDATFAVTNSQGSLVDSGDINNAGHLLTFDTSSSQASTLSGSISGAGGFIKTGSGEGVLSGTNNFSGGTEVLAGSLVLATADALPDGTSLTVGSGATFLFDPSYSAANLASAGLTAPAPDTATASENPTPVVAANGLANGPVAASAAAGVSPLIARPAKHLPDLPAIASLLVATSGRTAEIPRDMSRLVVDAVFVSRRSAFDQTISPADNAHSAISWAWLGVIEGTWNSTDRNKTSDSQVEALDKVLARFGV